MNEEESTPVLYKIFSDALKEEIQHFKGEFWSIIRLAPDLFELFINLATDPDIPSSGKHIINATITYFVVPHDVLPEDVYGAIGYLDDIFLCAWSLKQLGGQLGYGVLERHWKGDEGLKELIEEIFEKTHERIAEVEEDILEFVGLG